MGKPPFKVSEGGRFEIFMWSEVFTFGENQLVKEWGVPFRIKVRLEAFPNGLPMSVLSGFLQH
jgi:hypothetical protein